MGRFHVSLGFELCKVASMDLAISYDAGSAVNERKARAFWSLHILKASHGQSLGAPDVLDYLPLDRSRPDRRQFDDTPPDFPIDDSDPSDPTDCGIWTILLQLASAWGRTRAFVRSCVADKVTEPWRTDSMYAQINEELTKIESRTPMRHRWQNVKFYEQDHGQVERNGCYWKPWLAVQMTYHNILATINHPFLFIAAAQQDVNKHLAVLNTFWTRSSHLALLHATWIVRLADMISDRQMAVCDAIFGQAVAIAATVHLYYLSAVNPKLKLKSAVDLITAKRFLQSCRANSPLCALLVMASNHHLKTLSQH